MQSPADFDGVAVKGIILTAAYARRGTRLAPVFRTLGQQTVPDIGGPEDRVSLPGCWNTYWRSDGFWWDVGYAMDGSGREVAYRVTDPIRQNELDMLADVEHPLWKEI